MQHALEEQTRSAHVNVHQLQQEITRLKHAEEVSRAAESRAVYAEQQLVAAQEELSKKKPTSEATSVELENMSRVSFLLFFSFEIILRFCLLKCTLY